MKRKVLIGILAVILVVGLVSSGWIYNYVKDKNDKTLTEGQLMNTTLLRQYGNSIVVDQLVSAEKVYAATWKSTDGITHLSWNIGGVWVEVYRTPATTTSNPVDKEE